MVVHAGVGDTDSISSSDSLYFELMESALKHKEVVKVVCRWWDRMDDGRKKAWKVRATALNSRLLPGAFNSIPSELICLQFIVISIISNHIFNIFFYYR